MPETFDDSYSDRDDDAVAEVVDALDASPDQGDVDDTALEADVEQRLEVASLYKLLLRDSFFNTDTDASRIVTKRVRKFVKDELTSLLGMSGPARRSTSDFSPQQVDALGRLADKLLAKEGVAPAASEPQLRQVVAAPAPALKQRVDPRANLARPTPKAAPAPKKAPAAPRRVRSATAPVVKEVTDENVADSKKVFRVEAEDENGRMVREYVDASGKSIEGQKRDVTPQVRPHDALPMPSPDAMFAISQQQAAASVASAAGAHIAGPNVTTNMLVQHSIK